MFRDAAPVAPATYRHDPAWPPSAPSPTGKAVLRHPLPHGPAAMVRLQCRIACHLAAQALTCPLDPENLSHARTVPFVHARQLGMYLAYVAFGLSQGRVAEGFGRDRRAVAHACRKVEDRRDRPGFDRLVAELERTARWLVPDGGARP